MRVELTVTDVNDNVPEWMMAPSPYLAVVSPDAAAGALVYKLHAQDGDEGNNGEVEYFLSDGGLFYFLSIQHSTQVFSSARGYGWWPGAGAVSFSVCFSFFFIYTEFSVLTRDSVCLLHFTSK